MEKVAVLIILIFLSPLLVLLPNLGLIQEVPANLGAVIWQTILQSGLSALGSLLLAIPAASGLLALSSRYRSMGEFLFLLPSLLPTIVVIVLGFSIMNPFPFGLAGIVILHVFVNFGIVAIALAKIIENRFGAASLQCYLEGASALAFWRSMWPGLWRPVLLLGFTVFSFCLTSFAIPIVASGGKFLVLEAEIHNALKLENNFAKALGLSVVPIIMILVLSLLVKFENGFDRQKKSQPIKCYLLPNRYLLFLFVLFLVGTLAHTWISAPWGDSWRMSQELGFAPFLASLQLGLWTGLVSFSFLIFIFTLPNLTLFHQFLQRFPVPSASVFALGFLILLPPGGGWEHFKLSCGIFVFYFPSVFRTFLLHETHLLQQRHQQCELLGANVLLRQFWVLIPAVAPTAGYASGLLAVWAMGDFVFSRFLVEDQVHLAMIVDTLIGRYRLEEGLLVLNWLLILCGLVFLLFVWLGKQIQRSLVLSDKNYTAPV